MPPSEGVLSRIRHLFASREPQPPEYDVRALESRTHEILERWGLEQRGEARARHDKIIVVAAGADAECVVAVPADPALGRQEAEALRLWGGRRSAALLRDDADTGAYAMERLYVTEQFAELGLPEQARELGEIAAAATAPAGAMRFTGAGERVREAMERVETLSGRVRGPLPRHVRASLAAIASELEGVDEPLVVHMDLHSANVARRASDGAFTAYDAYPARGVKEFGLQGVLLQAHTDAYDRTVDPLASFRDACAAADADAALAARYMVIRMASVHAVRRQRGHHRGARYARRVVEAVLDSSLIAS